MFIFNSFADKSVSNKKDAYISKNFSNTNRNREISKLAVQHTPPPYLVVSYQTVTLSLMEYKSHLPSCSLLCCIVSRGGSDPPFLRQPPLSTKPPFQNDPNFRIPPLSTHCQFLLKFSARSGV